MTIKGYVDIIKLAETAYNAYGENRNWITFDGRPMPKWADLTEPIQIAWIAAVVAVRAALLPDNPLR